MTRQDYILLAEALSVAGSRADNEDMDAQWQTDCEAIAGALAAQSRGFDRELFLRNCGVQS